MVPFLGTLLDRQGSPSTRYAFWYGWLVGTVSIAGGFRWMLPFFQRFTILKTTWQALPLFLLFVGYHGLVFAFFAHWLRLLRTELRVPLTWLVPLVWVSCEFCFPCIFPWYIAITQAWVHPIIQIAEVTGPLGIGFLLTMTAAAFFEAGTLLWQRKASWWTLRAPITAAGIVALCVAYGYARMYQVRHERAAAPSLQMGVVQSNIRMQEKWMAPNAPAHHLKHILASQSLENQGVDLLVWPETAYPWAIHRAQIHSLRTEVVSHIRGPLRTPLLFGIPMWDPATSRAYNSAFLVDRGGNTSGHVDKNFLLVFGEYFPYLRYLPWLKKTFEITETVPGLQPDALPLEAHGKTHWLGLMICYEDILPSFGQALFALPHRPHVMVNLTNDAWFGKTSEPHEHLALSVFRAIEHRTDLLRVTNTGVTTLVDATGRVHDALPVTDPPPMNQPQLPASTHVYTVSLYSKATPFEKLGNGLGWSCLAVTLLFSLLAKHRQRKPIQGRYVLGALAGLQGTLLLLGLFVPSLSIKTVYQWVAHLQDHLVPEKTLLALVCWVGAGLIATSLFVGASLEWLFQQRLPQSSGSIPCPNTRLEWLLALVVTLVMPVTLWGRMEGNTGLVVILLLLCTLFHQLGSRVAMHWSRRNNP